MFLGAKLRSLRITSGQSLQQLAEEIGASKTHLSDLESGRSKNPSIDLLTKLAATFNVQISELIGGSPEKEAADPILVSIYRSLKELSKRDVDTVKALVTHLRKNPAPHP